MKCLALLLLTSALVVPAAPVRAEDEQTIAYFYPLRTQRPVIERELELRVEHEKAREGRTTEIAAAVETTVCATARRCTWCRASTCARCRA